MNSVIEKNALSAVPAAWRVVAIAAVIALTSACGGVDSSDGLVVNDIALPTDSSLVLYCEDAGIAGEPCILDDPDNPYAITPVTDDNKFQLSGDAPSAKARFYLWATAQAMSPRGENQYYTALSLHQMYGESNSPLAREQALRAYRSVLDNYFYSVTFFSGGNDVFFPFPVRKLAGENIHSPDSALTPLVTPVQALELFGQWGYTYDDVNTFDFTPNR